MIAIIDYGVGNLFSLQSSLKFLGLQAAVTNQEQDLIAADKIILPGVGAFSDAIRKLRNTGIVDTLLTQAKSGKPILGICLGMQLLFDKSFEYGQHTGLGLIPGFIGSIQEDLPERASDGGEAQPYKLKVPHIGWNSLKIEKEDPIFKYIESGDFVYYVHSYYAKECSENIIGSSNYDIQIPGVMRNKNVYGMQFHPEKSGATGLNLLKAFNEIQV